MRQQATYSKSNFLNQDMTITIIIASVLALLLAGFAFHQYKLKELRLELQRKHHKEVKLLLKELHIYKRQFVKSYYYSGTYPNWKAKQDLAQLLTLASQNPEQAVTSPQAKQLEKFLGKITEATAEVIQTIPEINLGVPVDRTYLNSVIMDSPSAKNHPQAN